MQLFHYWEDQVCLNHPRRDKGNMMQRNDFDKTEKLLFPFANYSKAKEKPFTISCQKQTNIPGKLYKENQSQLKHRCTRDTEAHITANDKSVQSGPV